MYRLLAIAKYDERYVIPPAHAEQAHSLEELATECSVSEYGGGQQDLFGEGSGCADADRGRELPDAPGPADRRLAGRPREQGHPGQPAQLGRQGLAARAVPAEGDGLVSGRRPKPALPPEQLTIVWQSVSLLLDYPDEDLLARARADPVGLAHGLPAADRRLAPRPSWTTSSPRRCRSSRPTTSRPSTPAGAATCS